jgi:gliding motility-associated-like protein
VRFCISIAIFIIPFSLLAQISAPGSNAVRYTSYLSDPAVKHPIFIYCGATGTEKGTLNAVSPGGTGPFNFAWYKWSDITHSFSILLKTESGVMNSSVTSLDEGGYNIIISGGYDTNLVGWIVFDKPPFAEAKLLNPAKHCNYVALNGTANATVASFRYYDPGTGNQLALKNELTFLWSSDPVSSIPYPSIEIDPITFTPPLEDVTYNLKVNTLGCSSESSFFYESIHINADFTVDPMEGEAPLEISLTDNSIRGYVYEWDFGDDSVSHLSEPLPHTYYKPGEYTVLLTIESELHCIDSLRSQIITVEPSSLAIPNVFTPDGDGYNDMFMIESKSLRYVSMEVFSRSGLKVYGFSGEGERLKEWTGWDGNINKSSIKASPGVYYYIIRAFGWDDIEYDSKEYRGFLYLYR